MLKRLVESPIWERLYALRDHFVGREVPVLVPPIELMRSAVGYVSGVIDLVYRDPDDDTIVVVDYKTDRVDSLEAFFPLAQCYERQGQIYSYAIKDALALDHEPRFELWFLSHGTILRGQRSNTPRKSNEHPSV